jgi:WD40 repeat protein
LITANVNTVQNSIAFNKEHKLIAYTAANTVLICDPHHYGKNVPKVLFSLRGHTERVNGVMWLTSSALVSVSSDKSLIIWSFSDDKNPREPQSWNYNRVYKDAHD